MKIFTTKKRQASCRNIFFPRCVRTSVMNCITLLTTVLLISTFPLSPSHIENEYDFKFIQPVSAQQISSSKSTAKNATDNDHFKTPSINTARHPISKYAIRKRNNYSLNFSCKSAVIYIFYAIFFQFLAHSVKAEHIQVSKIYPIVHATKNGIQPVAVPDLKITKPGEDRAAPYLSPAGLHKREWNHNEVFWFIVIRITKYIFYFLHQNHKTILFIIVFPHFYKV